MKSRLILFALVLALLIALAAAWSWSPLKNWLDFNNLVPSLQKIGQSLGLFPAIGGFALALCAAVPLTFLTVVTIIAFGPVQGFICALTAATLGAAISFGLGKYLGKDVVQRLGGDKAARVSAQLGKHGLLAVIAIRLVPVAPFAIVNMVAGVSDLRMRDMVFGTVLGMAPGTLLIAVFINPIIEAMQNPSPVTALIGLGMVLLIGLGIYGFKHWLRLHGDTK